MPYLFKNLINPDSATLFLGDLEVPDYMKNQCTMSQIFHRKKLDDFSAANMTKIKTNVKKGEVGLVEQRSFVG